MVAGFIPNVTRGQTVWYEGEPPQTYRDFHVWPEGAGRHYIPLCGLWVP